jgi:hypothetical protein
MEKKELVGVTKIEAFDKVMFKPGTLVKIVANERNNSIDRGMTLHGAIKYVDNFNIKVTGVLFDTTKESGYSGSEAIINLKDYLDGYIEIIVVELPKE